jgi:hypothetical protein
VWQDTFQQASRPETPSSGRDIAIAPYSTEREGQLQDHDLSPPDYQAQSITRSPLAYKNAGRDENQHPKNYLPLSTSKSPAGPAVGRSLKAWDWNYESPFRNWPLKSPVIGDMLCKIGGRAWAIPEDGRIRFALTPKGLSEPGGYPGLLPSSPLFPQPTPPTLKRWAAYDKEFRSSKGRAFLVCDLNPWLDRNPLFYDDGEIVGDRLWYTQRCRWDVNWENQDCDVVTISYGGPQLSDLFWTNSTSRSPTVDERECRLFRPIIIPREQPRGNKQIQGRAPWRRIM